MHKWSILYLAAMAWWWGNCRVDFELNIDKLPEDPHPRGHGLAADRARRRVLRRAAAAEDVPARHEGRRFLRLETYRTFVPLGRAGRRGRGRRGLHRRSGRRGPRRGRSRRRRRWYAAERAVGDNDKLCVVPPRRLVSAPRAIDPIEIRVPTSSGGFRVAQACVTLSKLRMTRRCSLPVDGEPRPAICGRKKPVFLSSKS